MTTILIVEDEVNLRKSLRDFLVEEGYTILEARNCREARELIAQTPSLVILDWRLPDGDGLELLRLWRAQGISLPILMLTAKSEIIDKVLGLEIGADDYLTKPFEPRELIARIKVQLRHSEFRSPKAPSIRAHGIELDPESRSVTFKAKSVDLTKLEFDLLKLLMSKPGRVFSRDELLNLVWGFEKYPTTRTVDTHILQLRNKFGEATFESVRGVGYRMIAEELQFLDTPDIQKTDTFIMANITKGGMP